MNDSVELLSSMSPKIRNKLKPGERQFRRVAGVSILALKRNVRSSIGEKFIATQTNQYLNIVERSSTESYESIKSNNNCYNDSLDCLIKNQFTDEDSIVVISDSISSSDSVNVKESPKSISIYLKNDEIKTEANCLLPKQKMDDISNWIDQVTHENNKTSSTVYTELSTIYGSDLGSEFIPKTKGHAVNSTSTGENNKPFDELFVKKDKPKVDKSISIHSENSLETSMSNLVVEDSFEIVNKSLKSRLQLSIQTENQNQEDNKSSGSQTEDNQEIANNHLDSTGVSDNGNIHDTSATKVLDELYGTSWRANKALILSKTEPRQNIKKPSIRFDDLHSERKPKLPPLYKNPYLDSEKYKSQNLLDSLNKARLKENSKSPWLQRLKILCDSDTNSESTPRPLLSKKLDFNDSSDGDAEDDKKSKYFKKKNKIKNDSSNKENKDLGVEINRDEIANGSVSSKSDGSLSSTNSTYDRTPFVTLRKPKKNIKNMSRGTLLLGSGSGSLSEKEVSDITKPKTTVKSTVRRIQISESSTSCSSTSSDSDKMIKSNKKTEKRGNVPRRISSSSTCSDEEWDKEVSKIDRKVKNVDVPNSFLASLSANIPISKCDVSARIFRNNFKMYKDQLVKKLYKLFNDEVFENVLPNDMLIEWNDKMRKTAGFCYCKKITKRSGQTERSARIVLSTKVVDTADRLRDTLIHELCHAATWVANLVSDGHGPYWKSWAFKAMRKFPELPVIKRCHNYAINTKYTYKCTGCGQSIGRHSKSLDIERKRCGICNGKFEVLINKVNKKGETKLVAATPKKEINGFALFVKENYGIYKTPDRKHGDVMKLLGQKFQAVKIDNKV